MSANRLVTPKVRQSACLAIRIVISRTRAALPCSLALCIVVQTVCADTITYQQLRQDQSGRATTVASVPTVARTKDQSQDQGQNQQGQTGQTGQTGQAGTAQESD